MEYLIITFVIISENIEGEQAPLYFYKFISFGLFRYTFQLILGKISIYYISIYYNLQEISTVYGVLSECNVQMFNKKKKC